jgi:plasmid stability protein
VSAIIDHSFAPLATETAAMASITIRNLEEDITQRFRVRAAAHGRSMEEEALEILRRELGTGSAPLNLAAAIRARLAPGDRLERELPARQPMRQPIEFD